MDRLSAGQTDTSILWLKSYRNELTGTWRAGEGKSPGKWDLRGVWKERGEQTREQHAGFSAILWRKCSWTQRETTVGMSGMSAGMRRALGRCLGR